MVKLTGLDAVRIMDVGTKFCERAYGITLYFTVTTPPIRSESGQWTWTGVTDEGGSVDFLISEGYEHYGPNIELC